MPPLLHTVCVCGGGFSLQYRTRTSYLGKPAGSAASNHIFNAPRVKGKRAVTKDAALPRSPRVRHGLAALYSPYEKRALLHATHI